MPFTSWLEISSESPFSLANIPFGIISDGKNTAKRPAVAIGDYAVDLSALTNGGAFKELSTVPAQTLTDVFEKPTLNEFASLGRAQHRAIREYIQKLFSTDTPFPHLLKDNDELKKKALIARSEVQTHVPMAIGDYTDFYAGLHHAYNVGVLFRGPDNALQPNYKHLPVGYHGRASSVQVSNVPVRRPNGQILNMSTKQPIFSACKKLDYELELAAFICKPNDQGTPININDAEEHIFGYVLMNDWSARDIQAWEYVPLGPFNSKNFATTITPWIVLADALTPFRSQTLEPGDRESLFSYLRESKPSGLDMALTVELRTGDEKCVLSRSNAKNLLFSFPQMVAHHTVTGCNMNVGDLLGSGTISGTTNDSLGSLLELSKNGKEPVMIASGIERTFLEDGDEVVLSGVCGEKGAYVGFGECSGRILPALSIS